MHTAAAAAVSSREENDKSHCSVTLTSATDLVPASAHCHLRSWCGTARGSAPQRLYVRAISATCSRWLISWFRGMVAENKHDMLGKASNSEAPRLEPWTRNAPLGWVSFCGRSTRIEGAHPHHNLLPHELFFTCKHQACALLQQTMRDIGTGCRRQVDEYIQTYADSPLFPCLYAACSAGKRGGLP